MVYVFEDGRKIFGTENLLPEEAGKYVAVSELPPIPEVPGKIGDWLADLDSQQLVLQYIEYEEPPKRKFI